MSQQDILKVVAALPNVWQADAHVEWTVQDMFPAASVNLLSAESGTGKTWLAYGIAGAVSRGEPFVGLSVKKTPVLYMDGENPLGVVKERLSSLAIPETSDLYLWGGWNTNHPPFGPSDPKAEQFARATKGFMIFDSLVEFHSGDESNATETRKYMRCFRNLANLGATVLILHNTGKASSAKKYRGSSDIKAAVDTAYTVEKVTGALGTASTGLQRLKIGNFKSRFALGKDFSVEFVAGEGFRNADEIVIKEMKEKSNVLESLLTEEPINGTVFKQKAKEMNISREAAKFLQTWPHQKPGTKPNEKVYYRPAREAIM